MGKQNKKEECIVANLYFPSLLSPPDSYSPARTFRNLYIGKTPTCGTRLRDDSRHGDGLDDGGCARFGGAGGDTTDAQDGGLGPRPTGLRGGDDGGGLAIC